MMMQELMDWAERASTIEERLGPQFDATPSVEGDSRFERWRTLLSKDKPDLFERRLDWGKLDAERARAACGRARLQSGEDLPEWARVLGEMIAEPFPTGQSGYRFFTCEGSWPFQEVLAPFVSRASSSLPHWDSITTDVQRDFERQLLTLLCEASMPVLHREFQVHRAVTRAVRGSMSGDAYSSFANRILDGGWRTVFTSYPLLARAFGTRIQRWRETTVEFLARLAADREALAQHFGLDHLGDVKTVRPGLSDPHGGGRTAIWVEFESGFECVYKPRNIDLEPAFQSILQWLEDRSLSTGFRKFRSLTREHYGWSEAVPHLPCESEEQVRRYYERIGALAAILHALGTTDCHQENVIACGEYPVLIDTETLLTPRAQTFGGEPDCKTGAGLAQWIEQQSILKSLLLPPGTHLPGREFAHLAGVMRADGDTTFQTLTWVNPNSDWMRLREQEMKLPAERNQVIWNGEAAGAERYVEEIVNGFDTVYRFLLEHREEVLNGPFQALRGMQIRAVCRATRIYCALLQNAFTPDAAADGVEASIARDVLARPFLAASERSPMFGLIEAEMRSMAHGDVPLFQTSADSVDMTGPEGERIERFFQRSGYDHMLRCMDGLSAADLVAQKTLIRGAFAATPYVPKAEQANELGAPLTGDELLAEAVAIAEQVSNDAIIAPDGSCLWMTVHPLADEGWALGPMSHSFYGGLSGVALFLAAVFQSTGDEKWRKLAQAAIRTVSGMIQQPYPYAVLGGGSGIPSTAYAILRCAGLLKDDRLRDEALRIAVLVTPELIAKDSAYDLISGSSGTILCLLVLHKELGDERLLRLAEACGEHLLATRTETESGHRSWATLDNKGYLAGLTHGAAGIALALERLSQATGDHKYRDAALEAVRYENTLFSKERSNWPDLRKKDVYSGSWCHGAPGIGLARLEFIGLAQEAADDVEACLRFSMEAPSSGIDHLCCGDLGLAALLDTAATRLSRPELGARAQAMVSRAVAGAKRRGHYRLNFSERFRWISFHQGLSGIGYLLLRMRDRDRLPDVLTWS